jgi:Tfp pilus assembly protein PilF
LQLLSIMHVNDKRQSCKTSRHMEATMKNVKLKKRFRVIAALAFILSTTVAFGNETFDKAYELMDQGKPVKALEYYEKAISEDPGSADIWQEYTICLRKLNRVQKALQSGWITMDLGIETAATWVNIGNVMIQAHAWEDCFQAYKKAAALTDNKAWAAQNFLNLGYEQWLFGSNDGARKAYSAALDLAPDYGPALLDMGNLYGTTGDTAKAKELLEKSLVILKNGNNKTGVEYASLSLKELNEKGKLTAPTPIGRPYQDVPRYLLKKPAPKQAAGLKIESSVKHLVKIDKDMTLNIFAPEEWLMTAEEDDNSRVTVEFNSAPGKARFHFLITPMTTVTEKVTLEDLKQIATNAGTKLLENSVETKLELFEVKGKQTGGYAYILTDKTYKKDSGENEYPIVTQGFFVSSGLMHVFTVLSDSKDKSFIESKLGAVQSILYSK